MSTPATGSEILEQLGTDILRTFVANIVHTITLTIYAVFVAKAVRVLWHKRTARTTMGKFNITIIVVLFLSALVLWILDVTNFIVKIKLTLLGSSNSSIADKYARAKKVVFVRQAAIDVIYSYMCNLGDFIVIWRACIFWRSNTHRWVLIIPCTGLALSFASSLTLTYCGVRLGSQIVDGSFQTPLLCKNVQTVSYSLTFATTAFATFLISVKTWEYRRMIRPLLFTDGYSNQVDKIMILLVESGIFYMIFFLIPVIGNIPGVETKRASSFAFLVYSYSTSVIVGLYPTIIVVLAHSQHAVLKTEADTQLPTITWRVAELPTETQLLQSRIDLVKEGTRRDDIEIDLTALGEEGTPEPLHKISHPPAATPQEMLETQTLERQPL